MGERGPRLCLCDWEKRPKAGNQRGSNTGPSRARDDFRLRGGYQLPNVCTGSLKSEHKMVGRTCLWMPFGSKLPMYLGENLETLLQLSGSVPTSAQLCHSTVASACPRCSTHQTFALHRTFLHTVSSSRSPFPYF